MKKLILISAVIISIIIIYGAGCKKNGYQDLVQKDKAHRDSIMSVFSIIEYKFWQISSQTTTTAGVTMNVPLDSCNQPISYVFNSLDSAVGNEGSMSLYYDNSICNGFTRKKDPSGVFFYLNVNPNTIQFPDDGHDLILVTYSIIKATRDSLVLRKQNSGSYTTEIYLSLK